MVFLHFPTNLTDEELVLQAKYVKLRKKKKALLEFTKPKAEPEKCNLLKRTLEPKEAKELAKKLVLSGKITVGGGKGHEQKTIFKRPNGLERKMNEGKVPTAIATIVSSNYDTTAFNNPNANTPATYSTSNAEVIPYTPFTSSTFNSASKRTPKQTAIVSPIRKIDTGTPTTMTTTVGTGGETPGTSSNSSSNNSGGRGIRAGRGGMGYNRYEANNGPKPGHTIHVKAIGGGRKLTEDLCKDVFGKVGGRIINITMELERNCGFVTFESIELAEKAIVELDRTYQRDNMLLSVSFARRQPPLSDLMNDPSPTIFWTHLASNQSQKSSHHDKRSQIVYTESDDLFN